MLTRNVYVVQPYKVGSNRKSLAIGIPWEISKECEIDTSTVFELKVDSSKKVTIQVLPRMANECLLDNKNMKHDSGTTSSSSH